MIINMPSEYFRGFVIFCTIKDLELTDYILQYLNYIKKKNVHAFRNTKEEVQNLIDSDYIMI